jgi:hypothetical protein
MCFKFPFSFLVMTFRVQGIVVKEFGGKPYERVIYAILRMLSSEDDTDDESNFGDAQILVSFGDMLPAYIDELASSVVSGYNFYKRT